ncbi:phage baseplate assembly protein V [uncultured Campylobacter sp.]|uniref:phage baseplate assembly protein V n=1 Tax=uncultured Campylobacter sp. TaxID=218934 RepID=UPI00262E7814|nr:phage baseplate assembly protein V [uncultured Campylobacter sp.]
MSNNLNEIGIVSEVNGDRARVAIGDMVTDFLPVFQPLANSFAISFAPIRVGEQVLVLPVRGELNAGLILRGIYQTTHKASPTDTKIHVAFEDGVRMSYDTASSSLEISSPKQINIACENASLTAKSVNVKADDTTVQSGNIKLLGNTLIQGSISTAGSGGGSGSFKINGDVKVTGSLKASGDISDGRASLSSHTNGGVARD